MDDRSKTMHIRCRNRRKDQRRSNQYRNRRHIRMQELGRSMLEQHNRCRNRTKELRRSMMEQRNRCRNHKLVRN